MRGDHKTYEVPKRQADAVLDQAAPVSGVKYVVLDTTKNVKVISVMIQVTWTVQPTPLELHVTVDGIPMIFKKTDPVSTSVYFPQANPDPAPTAQFLVTTADAEPHYTRYTTELLSGRSVKIEAETTGGTVSNLSAKVKYAKF